MTKEEIRAFNVPNDWTEPAEQLAHGLFCMLREIAAQLAELNEHLPSEYPAPRGPVITRKAA